MTRQNVESESVVADMNIVETAVVSLLATLGVVTGSLAMALVWGVVGMAPVASPVVGIGVGIGLPVLLVRLGRTAVRRIPAHRRDGGIDARAETTS